MSAKKFKFVSPGVFLSEIDNSQLPKEPGGVGPVIIGRCRRGPAMKPVKVSSFQEFVEIFGEPLPGNEGEDTWREGNGLLAPAYGPYAAQAYLRADINSPVTVIRLLGIQGDDASDAGHAGWEAESAFGIFVAPGVTDTVTALTASLVGVIYAEHADLEVGIEGNLHSGSTTSTTFANISGSQEVKAVDVATDAFTIAIKKGATTVKKSVSLREGPKYIRDRLNTNPVATNTDISSIVSGTLNEHYWLGETFEETYEEVKRSLSGDQKMAVFVSALDPQMADFKSQSHQLDASVSGWVIPQHVGTAASYEPTDLEKLFRFHAIQEGEQGLDISVEIQNIKIAETGNPSPFGRFDVVVHQRRGDRIYVVDSFENLNLNPNSDNFIARRIGDQYFEWDSIQKRNKVYGSYPNNSSYIRVELGGRLAQGQVPDNPRSVPFGFLGPVKLNKRASATATTSSFSADADWVTGSVVIQGSTALKLQWPSAPHVTTGSTGIDLQRRYVLGSTSYNREQGTNNINHVSVNKGMKDYLRKAPSFGTLVSKQISGVADGTSTVHAYKFSLDDVVITGAVAPGDDLSGYFPTAVDFIEGSHAGTPAKDAIPEVAGAAGQATITLDMNDEAIADILAALDGSGFTLFDTTGTAVPFVFSDEVNHDDGREVVSDGANKVVIGVNGCGDPEAVADRIVATINALDGRDMPGGAGGHNRTLAITATKTASAAATFTVTLDQDNNGASGNGSVTQDAGLLNLNGDADADMVISAFSGGTTAVAAVDAVAGVPGTAYTSLSSGGGAIELLRVVNSFCMPLVGGCDGVDVTEADPFNMSSRTVEGKSTRTSYAYATLDRAIELMKDPEALETNLAIMPGVTNKSLTTKLVQTCEARADALAIIDLPDIYIPPAQKSCTSFKDRVDGTTPELSAKNLIARQINSSYGAAYYPWVKVRDTISARDIWAPPSVVALGVMAYTEQRDEVWFAPAGFNRGGLNEGNAGLPVLQVSEQLLSSQRDRLYEANINPIASFVSEGLVVFGQKTLQMTPSALDRINVRRLLIFVKKEISRIANGLLFDQNVPATWNRFTGQVVPFLESVKTRLGLTDFKVVLDRTTTTPDLVDRNIMYAKIFLKPARAIEFIAVDFVITRTGASFDD